MAINILGISAYYHDSAAALVQDGKVLAAAQEERFSRKKHDSGFPAHAVRFCLEQGGVNASEVDAVVFYDKPFLKFERLLETYLAFAPKGFRSFAAAVPVWIREKLFLRGLLEKELRKAGLGFGKKSKLLFSLHHLSHAASAFFPSPFEDAAILTVDGVGEWATTSLGSGKGNRVRLLQELHFPHSIGLLYSAFTYYVGFRVNSGEYKLMGLAPYGNPDSPETKKFERLIRENLVDIKPDGSVWLNQEYFNYATGLTMVHDRKWERLFGVPRRAAEAQLTQSYCNMALAIQAVTEDIMLRTARHVKGLTGSENLCLAGGVALNCVANAKILEAGIFKRVWIQPAAGDAGGALGAALAAYYMYFGQDRAVDAADSMQGSYLGPEFSDMEAEKQLKKYHPAFERCEDFDVLADKAGALLAQGKVVGWFQGRMEWGPRALGNRSILGDPRNPDMQKKMNLKIKFRESFRPFAPAVLEEDAPEYFDSKEASPYMLLVAPVARSRRQQLPEGYRDWDLEKRLYFQRSEIPAVTHLDFSARYQTVSKKTNPRYWGLIDAFKRQTGCPVVVNTSFNVRGEPIVCTPEDAYKCFMNTDMDALVVGNLLYEKERQPAWKKDTAYSSQLD